MLFDTHAHYDDERFDEDRDALLASMPENNVGLILNPGCDAGTSRKAVGYANRYPFVYAAVGLHPENIEDGWTQTLDEIRTLAQSEPRVRAIGEIGLDYYWEKEERARARQQVVFARQMELARELIAAGRLDGVEIDHPRNTPEDRAELTRLAKENGLIVTGGTDYHGINTVTPRPVGAFTTSDEMIARIGDIAKARKSTYKRQK